jgi:hypothetical protein
MGGNGSASPRNDDDSGFGVCFVGLGAVKGTG